jgi:L-methionine (R)-S-oxide reductase
MTPSIDWLNRLRTILEIFDCQTGTLHRTAADSQSLELLAQMGVPAAILDKVTTIPFGKGIAGAAAERKEPVELCNLQQDLGGVAKVDARQTGVAGSIAVPILSAHSGAVLGTLGIGKFTPYDFNAEEKFQLNQLAAEIAVQFTQEATRDD